MSIKPEYVDMIFRGIKRFEFRKNIFKKEVDKVFIYATKPVSKIVGFFTFERILRGSPWEIWKACSKFGGMQESEFFDYFKDCEVACAIKIDRAFELQKHVYLYEIVGVLRPPRSFIYIDDSLRLKVRSS